MFNQRHSKNIAINSYNFFSYLQGLFSYFKAVFCSGEKLSDMKTKGNTDHFFLNFSKKNIEVHSEIFDFSSFQHQ